MYAQEQGVHAVMHFKRVDMQFSVCLLSALLGVAPSGSLSVPMRACKYGDGFVCDCLCIWSIECIRVMHPSAVVLVLEITTLVGHLPL